MVVTMVATLMVMMVMTFLALMTGGCSLCEAASLALLNARPSAQPSMKLKMMMLAAIMMRRIIHDCIGFLWFYNSHKNLITFRPKMAKKKAITF